MRLTPIIASLALICGLTGPLTATAEQTMDLSSMTATDSGLEYKVVREGSGDRPTASDTVEVNYEGTLEDGTKFDSSYDRGQTIEFPLNGVIRGWTEGVQLMTPGSEYRVRASRPTSPTGERGIPGTIPRRRDAGASASNSRSR